MCTCTSAAYEGYSPPLKASFKDQTINVKSLQGPNLKLKVSKQFKIVLDIVLGTFLNESVNVTQLIGNLLKFIYVVVVINYTQVVMTARNKFTLKKK